MNNHIVQKTGWKIPVIAGIAGLAFGGLAATGVTMAVTDSPTGSQSSCVAAIGHADEAIDIYSQGFNDAADAVDGLTSFDYAAVDRSTENLNQAANRLEPLLADYFTTSEQCIGGGING